MPKILLEAHSIHKSYGMRRVLDIEKIELTDGDRIGLIGENGAGKSTLLDILAGRIPPDGGFVRRFCDVSVIKQSGDAERDTSDPAIASLFAAQDAHEGLSGGEMTRRRIAGALSGDGQILFADEPTTDLDEKGVAVLKKKLSEFQGAVVLISHDRALLDEIAREIWEIEDGRLTRFPGNYTAYRAEKERRRAYQQFEYDQYRSEKSRLLRSIQGRREDASQVRKAPSRMGNSEARLHRRSATEIEEKLAQTRKALESRVARLEVKERPREDPSIRMALGASSGVTSKVAIAIKHLKLTAGNRVLVKSVDLTIPTGSKTALMGENGVGKTTLLTRIMEGGYGVRISPGVRIGWFDQNHARTLDMEKTVLENVMYGSPHPESDARTVLARLGIRGDDAFKQTQVLSGGEKAKVALSRLFLAPINTLILDEPTNSLDVFTMEKLEELLLEYRGTVLFVSHDRRFVERIATRLAVIHSGSLSVFEGTLPEYEARKAQNRSEDDKRLRASAIRMEMANLSAKIDSASVSTADKEKWTAEYFALAKSLRELEK